MGSCGCTPEKPTKPAGCAARLLILVLVLPSAALAAGGVTGDVGTGGALLGWIGLATVFYLSRVDRRSR